MISERLNNTYMITIRKAEKKDLQAYIEMEKEFDKYYRDRGFDDHLKPFSYEDIPEVFFTNSFNKLLSEDNFFCVAEDNGRVVGYAEAEIVEPYEKELYEITKTGHINSIFVFDEYRKMGIGKSLISEAMKWMKTKGIDICTLGVVYENNPAVAAYEKLGFNKERIRMWKEIM